MQGWKNALYATFLLTLLTLLIGASFAAIWLINAKDARDALARALDVDRFVTVATVYPGATMPPYGVTVPPNDVPVPPNGLPVPPNGVPPGEVPQRSLPPVTFPSEADTNQPAKCAELKSLPHLKLPQLAGKWILEEKLEFSESSTSQVAIERQDKSNLCMRLQLREVKDNYAEASIDFHTNETFSKNFSGDIKVKEDGYWDFRMLSRDHFGVVIDSNADKHFTFVECIPAKRVALNNEPANPVDSIIPGSLFVFTRRQLPDSDMTKIRKNAERILRHRDETFIDYGAYCL